MITTIRTTSENKDFRQLVHLLDQYLAGINGDANDFFVQHNQIDLIPHVVLVYDEEQPIACGAMKEYDPQTMEVKRMFVHPEKRGNNIAGFVIAALEDWAKELHYSKFVLETSITMTSAVALYKKHHFLEIPRYGPYKDVESSVCFEKSL